MLNVIETTKRLFGRTISDEEIELANKKTEIMIKDKSHIKVSRLYTMDGEFPVIIHEVRGSAVTPDASYGWDMPHRGLCTTFRRERKYTKEGKLLKQHVRKNRIGPQTVYVHGEPKQILDYLYSVPDKFRVFNPPGRVFGKKIKEREYSGISENYV